MSERLTEARLRSALGARPFQLHAQIGSTNDAARAWGLTGAVTGALVVAEEQTSGRGRFARAWRAPPETALLFSVIVRPALRPSQMPRVSMIGAVAVAECLEAIGLSPVSLKWPNDVLLAGRKVAGILPEADWAGDRLGAVALGIGLNVRVDFGESPLAASAISLETVMGTQIDRAILLGQILRRIDYWSARIADAELLTAWRIRLATIGQQVTATSGSGTISGVASGVDADGGLLITGEGGAIYRVIAGEVTLRAS